VAFKKAETGTKDNLKTKCLKQAKRAMGYTGAKRGGAHKRKGFGIQGGVKKSKKHAVNKTDSLKWVVWEKANGNGELR